MEYFDGVEFLNCGEVSEYRGHIRKVFEDYYAIQYNHAGGMYCGMGDEMERHVSGPHAFISCPGVLFRYGPEPDSWRHHMFVCFKGARVFEYLRKGLLLSGQRDPLVRIRNYERFYADMRELRECLDSGRRNYPRAVNLLEGLLLRINQDATALPGVEHGRDEAFVRLAGEIRTKPELDWDFRKEALALGMSYIHFRRLFHRYLGSAPGQFLIYARLSAAAVLLERREVSVGEAAERFGFCDVHHFSKLFRKNFFVSPSVYRREFFSG